MTVAPEWKLTTVNSAPKGKDSWISLNTPVGGFMMFGFSVKLIMIRRWIGGAKSKFSLVQGKNNNNNPAYT